MVAHLHVPETSGVLFRSVPLAMCVRVGVLFCLMSGRLFTVRVRRRAVVVRIAVLGF